MKKIVLSIAALAICGAGRCEDSAIEKLHGKRGGIVLYEAFADVKFSEAEIWIFYLFKGSEFTLFSGTAAVTENGYEDGEKAVLLSSSTRKGWVLRYKRPADGEMFFDDLKMKPAQKDIDHDRWTHENLALLGDDFSAFEKACAESRGGPGMPGGAERYQNKMQLKAGAMSPEHFAAEYRQIRADALSRHCFGHQ